MNGINVKQYENIDKAINRFLKINNSILSDIKKNRYYEKPSETRNKKNQDMKRLRKIAKKIREGYHFKKIKQKQKINNNNED